MFAVAELMVGLRAAEEEHCRGNICYFVESYCCIEDKDRTDGEILQPFVLWPMQRDALVSLHENRLNVILKARQLGITWMALAKALHVLRFYPGSLVMALSRTEEEAKELVRRLCVMCGAMPAMVGAGAGAVYVASALQLEIVFEDGRKSVFKAFPAAANAGRSFTADLLILDEWAFQQNARTIWAATYPTINRPSGGQVVGLSTIERGTLFEEIFCGDNGFNKIFLPWFADPRRDAGWYARTKRDFTGSMQAEYPASAEEALAIPGGAFFAEVAEATHDAPMPKEEELEKCRVYACLDYGLDMLSVHLVAEDEQGRAVVFAEFDAPDMDIEAACGAIKGLCAGRQIEQYLAPPDLWSREQLTGRGRADWFLQFGVPLTKTAADRAAGCASMKQWLRVPKKGAPALKIVKDACPKLWNSLVRIQRDKKKPDMYAVEPHDLTHDCDSLRCFCVWWTQPATAPQKPQTRWHADMLEDYRKAGEGDQKLMREMWGEPYG